MVVLPNSDHTTWCGKVYGFEQGLMMNTTNVPRLLHGARDVLILLALDYGVA